MKKNIIDKLWEDHVIEQREGYPGLFAIDLHLIHEVTSPQAFQVLRDRGLRVFDPGSNIATIDHNVSTTDDRRSLPNPISRDQISTLRRNAKDFSIRLFDMGSGWQGIVHIIGPEMGLSLPGMTIVCGDSHTATHGAFGALAFGIGTSEVSHVLATGSLLQIKPKTMKVEFLGSYGKGISAKDLILKLIKEIGLSGAQGYVIEYCGDVIRKMDMEERMIICNLSIECGARAGLIAPDDITFEYLKARPASPQGEQWDEAVDFWRTLPSDAEAKYDSEITLNIEGLAPMITWGTNPAQAIEIEEAIPKVENMNKEQALLAKHALEYVKLKGGSSLIGTPIDYVFLGSCTNARISDFRAAAMVLKGRRIAKGVKAYFVPGSERVRKQIIEEGLDRIFYEAGITIRQAGCSACLAMNEDKPPPGKRCASTSNRNFISRQGPGSITHLMSPLMLAATAVRGEITDARDFI
ncbi:MAG: 3-isopropylmalate/(R)-2-methylmalate dehydratase large subunit [Chlamydiales bacterium]|jgi:3-isopropylmalate/(R)-2-methylmalate dehydratase large subunit